MLVVRESRDAFFQFTVLYCIVVVVIIQSSLLLLSID